MTVCADCGGPVVDPDTAHHRADCEPNWWDEPDWCECPPLCAACCGYPGCPTRAPQETPTMDLPDITEVIDIDALLREVGIRIKDGCWTGEFEAFDSDEEMVLALARTVEQTRRERDAAYAVILRAMGLGHAYGDDVWFDMENADGVTAWRLANHYPPKWEPMTPSEIDAIRRARAVPGAEEDQ